MAQHRPVCGESYCPMWSDCMEAGECIYELADDIGEDIDTVTKSKRNRTQQRQKKDRDTMEHYSSHYAQKGSGVVQTTETKVKDDPIAGCAIPASLIRAINENKIAQRQQMLVMKLEQEKLEKGS